MRLFFSFLILSCASTSLAQNWAPFPLSQDSQWRVNTAVMNSNGTCLSTWHKTYHIGSDTVIQANSYQTLLVDTWFYSMSPWNCAGLASTTTDVVSGFIRQDGSIVYYRDMNEAENVLFDWSLEVGDTIPNDIVLPENDVVRVESIDSVEVNGLWRKRFNAEWNLGWIIEGVGHSGGLIEFFGPSLAGSNQLICYGESDIPLYPQLSSCNFIVGLVDETADEALLISPNPSSGIFNLDLQQQFNYRVFDLLGKLVDKGGGSGQSAIELSSKPNGIYLLRVDSEKGSFAQKLVKQ